MNKTDARKLADILTNNEISDMLQDAKDTITDWTVRSDVNKLLSKGAAWNFLAKDFDCDKYHHVLAKKNIIWEFGDYLPEELKIKKTPKKDLPEIMHQEPDFSNYE